MLRTKTDIKHTDKDDMQILTDAFYPSTSFFDSAYVMKTDDDMFINLPNLNDLVKTNQNPHLLIGSIISNAAPIRESRHKWYVPDPVFPESLYPNYLSGILYGKYFIL